MISSKFPPHLDGGIGRVVGDLTDALSAHPDFCLDVVTGTPGQRVERAQQENVRVIRFPRSGKWADRSGRWQADTVYRRLKDEWRTAPAVPTSAPAVPTIVHVHSVPFSRAAVRIKEKIGCGMVYTCHSVLADSWKKRHGSGYRKSLADQERLLTNADIVTVPSGHTAGQLRRCYPKLADKVRVLPNGIRYLTNLPQVKRDRNRLLYAGRLTRTKGIDVLVHALKHLRDDKRMGNLRLDIAGRGHRLDEIRLLLRSLRLDDRSTLHGWLSPEELNRLYGAVQLVVVPSRSESFGLIPYEALNHATPVMVHSIEALRDIPTDVAWHVDTLEPRELAGAIRLALRRPEQLEAMAARGRVWVKQFDWSRIAEEYVDLYEELVVSRNRRAK